MRKKIINKYFGVGFSLLILWGCSEEANKSADSITQSDAAPTKSETVQAEVKSFGDLGYTVVESFNVGSEVYVRSMAIDESKQTLWVGTSVGVLEVDLKTRNMLNTFTREHGLANEYVFDIFVDSKGMKWLGTNGGGITTYNNGDWKTYFPMHGLADYWVYSFTEQKNGTLWIGTWAGLNALKPGSENFDTYVKELVNEWVYGLDVDDQDRVWIGTEGGINMFDGSNWAVWTHKDGLGASNEENLPISDNTGLGTRSRHDLSVMTAGAPTYNPNYVFSLIVAQDQTVWAGTWGGGVSHFDGNKWTNFTKNDGLGGNIVYNVAQDATGKLWFGTNGGLSSYDGKNWYNFTTKDGLLDNNIYAIVSSSENDIWAGSRNGVVLISKN